VWNIGPILQGLASTILSWIIAAISGLGNALDDVDRSPNGMPVKRGYATGWIGHLNHDKFPIIAGQWKTFENLTYDTRKPDLLGADGPVDRFTHGISSLIECAVLGVCDMACSLSLAPLASFDCWRGRSAAGPSH
jgi:hypothetical protein